MKQPTKKAIIIGAGIAGLAAAAELRRQGVDYIILEASHLPGGRVRTTQTPSGHLAEEGMTWLHGRKDGTLYPLLSAHGVDFYTGDDNQNNHSYYKGKRCGGSLREGIFNAVAAAGSARKDQSIAEFVPKTEDWQLLEYTLQVWLGQDGKMANLVSARDMANDPFAAGGYQFNHGVREMIDILANMANRNKIYLNTAVASIDDKGQGAVVRTQDGREFKADMVICTASAGVLQSGLIDFGRPLSGKVQNHLDHISMGKMTKAIYELDPAFIVQLPALQDMRLHFPDSDAGFFVYIRDAKKPLLTVFFGGDKAIAAESMTPDEINAIVMPKLRDVPELQGFEKHISPAPVLITDWNKNPLTQGTYSTLLAGGTRTGPVRDGKIIFAGEAFDDKYPAYGDGAFNSGMRAAGMAARELNPALKAASSLPSNRRI